jgi:hypothetical protein
MTKIEFLENLSTTPPIDRVGTSVFSHEMFFGDKLYSVVVRKFINNKINYETIYFIVKNEGTPEEEAFFFQRNSITFENTQEVGPITEI